MELPEESLRFKSYQINTQRRGHAWEKGKTLPPPRINKKPQTKQQLEETSPAHPVPVPPAQLALGELVR